MNIKSTKLIGNLTVGTLLKWIVIIILIIIFAIIFMNIARWVLVGTYKKTMKTEQLPDGYDGSWIDLFAIINDISLLIKGMNNQTAP
jgi:amino acid transporter